MTKEREITEQEFRRAMLLGIQVMSQHLCAMTLGSRKPNPKFRGSWDSPRDKYTPLETSEQMYHMGSQQQFNMLIDKLYGTDKEEKGLGLHAVPSAFNDPNSPVDLSDPAAKPVVNTTGKPPADVLDINKPRTSE